MGIPIVRPPEGYFPWKAAEGGLKYCQSCNGQFRDIERGLRQTNGYRACGLESCVDYLKSLPKCERERDQNNYYFRAKAKKEAERKRLEEEAAARGETIVKQEGRVKRDVKTEDGSATAQRPATAAQPTYGTFGNGPITTDATKKEIKEEDADTGAKIIQKRLNYDPADKDESKRFKNAALIRGFTKDEAIKERPACGFFPLAFAEGTNFMLCQACQTVGRYIQNGYRSCFKARCKTHLNSLPPSENIALKSKERKKRTLRDADGQRIEVKPRKIQKQDRTSQNANSDNASSSSGSSDEESSQDSEDKAENKAEEPVKTIPPVEAVIQPASPVEPVVQVASPVETTPEPIRSPEVSSEEKEPEPTAAEIEEREAKLATLKKLLISGIEKVQSQGDLEKRFHYMRTKVKDKKPMFDKPNFKDLIVTSKENALIEEEMQEYFTRMIERKEREEENRRLVELRVRERKEPSESIYSKRIRVLLRKESAQTINSVMSGNFHPRASTDLDCKDEHGFTLVRKEIYGKERWALKYADKEEDSTNEEEQREEEHPERRSDLTDFALCRVLPLDIDSPLRKRKSEIPSLGAVDDKQKVSPVDIDDTKHVKMDEIISILETVSTGWEEHCVLLFRLMPKPVEQIESKIFFSIRNESVQDHLSFGLLPDMDKMKEDYKVKTVVHEVEALKVFPSLWYHTIPLICDRCQRSTAPTNGMMMPREGDTWNGNRYSLEEFVCTPCVTASNNSALMEKAPQPWVEDESPQNGRADSQQPQAEPQQPSLTTESQQPSSPSNSNDWNSNSWYNNGKEDSNSWFKNKNWDKKKCQYCKTELKDWAREINDKYGGEYLCAEEDCLKQHTWKGSIKPQTGNPTAFTFISCPHLLDLAPIRNWDNNNQKRDVFVSATTWDRYGHPEAGTDITFQLECKTDSKGQNSYIATRIWTGKQNDSWKTNDWGRSNNWSYD